MIYIFYNSLSKVAKQTKRFNEIITKCIEAFNDYDIEKHDVAKVNNLKEIMHKCTENDKVVLIGDDMTFSNIVNLIYQIPHLPDIYAYKYGDKCDFLREISRLEKVNIVNERFFKINDYIKNLPVANYDINKRIFLNSIGISSDQSIWHFLRATQQDFKVLDYLSNLFHQIDDFRILNKCKIFVDGEEYYFNDVLFIMVMNGKYCESGVRIAPHANRKADYVNLIVVHNVTKVTLNMLLFAIYFGEHLRYRRYITEFKAKEIKIECPTIREIIIDGERCESGKIIKIKKHK
ncbi:hypothetical protein DA803_01835 [[Mycoplasma] phocae]|uniref:YegS/DAGK C-terminal domain-containing protein n=1 Tax=[Mycoplasma] phocae TaxID=142651 RepID=A0A2Z5IQ35_9BACT|nr:hypothetical protein [[Mycoplasma] phocae]AXE60825.1 hypothetical protein DA803_01835 [[Mycoplasma] phocae]